MKVTSAKTTLIEEPKYRICIIVCPGCGKKNHLIKVPIDTPPQNDTVDCDNCGAKYTYNEEGV